MNTEFRADSEPTLFLYATNGTPKVFSTPTRSNWTLLRPPNVKAVVKFWHLLDAAAGQSQLRKCPKVWMSTKARRRIFLTDRSSKGSLNGVASASAFVMDVSPPKPASP